MVGTTQASLVLGELRHGHAALAAELVTDRVRALRARVPILPARWADPVQVVPLIEQLAARGLGMVAMRGDRLVAFQAGTLIDGHGGRWAYTPDVGHGARGPEARRAREALYARLAEAWVRDACVEHTVTVLADDDETLAALGGLGFG